MRTITSVCFGFALALSAFALTSAPTSALEAPTVTPIVNGGVTRVDEREEREERCEHVRRECRERHGDREEYRECVERHQCEHGEREREYAERCERVRDECRERHHDREEFRECVERHECG